MTIVEGLALAVLILGALVEIVRLLLKLVDLVAQIRQRWSSRPSDLEGAPA
jgi:hypothetical protein